MSDSEVPVAPFALADAHLIIASEHGFASWPKFARHIEALTGKGSRPSPPTSAHFAVPSDPEIRKILIQRIDEYRQSVGIVVGVVEPAGRRIVTYGAVDKGDQGSLTGDTVFEIGWMTSVFTALLLTDMVQRGEVAFSDPVAKWLPAIPRRSGRQVTLQDLAARRSVLPVLPSNFEPKDPSNPYADYTAEQLYEFLSTYELPGDVDSNVEHPPLAFGILAFGLLGHALEQRTGMDYESLLRTRILDPLGMNSTRVTLTPDLKARLAPGHDQDLERVANWDFAALAGSGALRSTANDLLRFLSAMLGYTQSPLRPAMTATLRARRATRSESPIGWSVVTLDGVFARDGHSMVYMHGATAGYRAFLGFDSKARTGVVVLTNAFSIWGALSGIGDVDDIGHHLLDARFPLNQLENTNTEKRRRILASLAALSGMLKHPRSLT